MPITKRNIVNVTLMIDDNLKAVDLLAQVLFAKMDGITVIDFDWPKAVVEEKAA